jgi:hypothetical protein
MSDYMNFISDFIKTFSGYILVAIAGVLVGLFITLNATDKSCYLKIKFGDNMISILQPDITDFDYRNMPAHKASALCTKLKGLEYDDVLSEQIRNLRNSFEGPFQKRLVEIYVKFIDNHDEIINHTAGGYEGDLLKQELVLFNILYPEELSDLNSQKKVEVMIESIIPQGITEDEAKKTIFIDKKFACEWLNIKSKEALPNKMKVVANMLGAVGNRTKMSGIVLASSLPK